MKDVPPLGMLVGSESHKVIIIGSGPAGYTAGLYAARALLDPLMFAGYMSGGQLMLTSDVENFPGYPAGIGGPEMMIHMREQAERFGLEVRDKNVERVDFSERPFGIWVEGEEFKNLVLKDKEITQNLTLTEIETSFDLDHQLRHVDTIFKRVFGV